jgi:hypothetical protein
MDANRTVVVAWYAGTSSGSSNSAIYSSTRSNATGWSATPAQLCADTQDTLAVPLLAAGENGTVAAVWWRSNSNPTKSQAVSANTRDPGGSWGATEVIISDWVDDLRVTGLEVWPDGTAVALWSAKDITKSPAADEGVFWTARHGGIWGGGGKGQLGDWVDEVIGASLKLGPDGRAYALWAVKHPSTQNGVIAANWQPGGPWGTPESLGSGYSFSVVYLESLALGPDSGDAGAVWLAANNSTPSQIALFYADTGSRSTFLPMLFR